MTDTFFPPVVYRGSDPLLVGHTALAMPTNDPNFIAVQTDKHTNHEHGSWSFGWHPTPIADWKEAE